MNTDMFSAEQEQNFRPDDANRKLTILVDHRENPSGIPRLLVKENVNIRMTTLTTGDYMINPGIIIERKSAEDFIQSLVSNRLFDQCARLAKSGLRPFLLMEGNPCKTHHKIDDQAVKGALLSVAASWQIPVIYSENIKDSACLILMLASQQFPFKHVVSLNNYKPKRLKNHRLRFLQGLPQTGPVLANRLYEHFKSIQAIVNANEKELMRVDGIGNKTAAMIRKFLTENEQ